MYYGLKVRDRDDAIVETTILDQLLAVPGHDPLGRREGVRVEDRGGAQHRDVRSVEVPAVEHRAALEAEQDLAVREERVLEQLDLPLDGARRGDPDVNPVLGESVTATEVVQLFELAGDIRAGDHPVGWATECGAVDDVRDLQHLVEERDVAVCEVDRGTSRCAEVVDGANRGRDDEVVDDFAVDLGDHFVGHEVGESSLGVNVVDALEVLSRFERPSCLELSSYGTNAVRINGHRDFWLEGVIFKIELVIRAGDCSARDRGRGAAECDLDFARAVVEVGGCRRRVHDEGWTIGAGADQDEFRSAIGVEADLEARGCIFAVVGI